MASRSQTLAKENGRAADAPPPDDEPATGHFLLFESAGASYALPLGAVAEIIRMPKLSFMPLVPPSLLGLANLRGTVLPAISLRRLMNRPEAEASDMTRIIVLNGASPVGFVVDRIDRLAAAIDSESQTEILDPARLISGQFERLGVAGNGDASRSSVKLGAGNAAAPHILLSLLSFDIGPQEYALPLDSVREIVALPEQVSDVPHAEAAVLGVVTLRDRVLPLVSLRALLGLPADEPRAQAGKVVVVSVGDAAVGFVVDGTREILRVDSALVDSAPALLSRGAGEADVTSLCRLDQGRRLVAVLSPDRLFRSDLVSRILAGQGSAATLDDVQSGSMAMAEEQFIVFRLGGQEYAMPIAAVSEVARMPEHITHVPKAPGFIDGVINLRGGVVPVIDLRRRFAVPASGDPASQRILVLGIGAARAGFLVDSVAEVLKVPTETIRPAPDMSPDQSRLLPRVINLEDKGRMVLLVDPAELLDRIESDILAEFESAQANQAPAT